MTVFSVVLSKGKQKGKGTSFDKISTSYGSSIISRLKFVQPLLFAFGTAGASSPL